MSPYDAAWLNRCLRCSVVIKVGMLGDSQIGKTSLMVKYVEGHFDEDYIQTLGAYAIWLATRLVSLIGLHSDPFACCAIRTWPHRSTVLLMSRRQLHGEDYLCTADDNHILDMGLGWSAGIRQYATACVQ